MKCYVITLNWSSGCEADATSTEVMAVFTEKEYAYNYLKILHFKIKWHNYYEGYLDIEEIPFNPIV